MPNINVLVPKALAASRRILQVFMHGAGSTEPDLKDRYCTLLDNDASKGHLFERLGITHDHSTREHPFEHRRWIYSGQVGFLSRVTRCLISAPYLSE